MFVSEGLLFLHGGLSASGDVLDTIHFFDFGSLSPAFPTSGAGAN